MEAQTNEKQIAAAVQQMSIVLHDLCQPLTALQCRLQMAELTNTCKDYREAVALGLPECARLARHVHSLRELLQQALAAGEEETLESS